MSPTAGFVVWLVVTLVLLAGVVWTGLRAMRRVHIPLVACTLGALWMSVLYAYDLGRIYDLRSAGIITPIHLALAKIAAASFVLPLVTGVRTIFVPRGLKLHRRAAFLALTLTLLAFCTGAAMILLAERRA